jgi:hypothetical protein
MTMQPTDPVSITLEQRQWNDVLDALHDAKFRMSAPLIGSIMQQFQKLMEAEAASQQPPHDPAKPNGSAVALNA